MDGTDTWVIVIAAFGGGLFGAVLQPIVSHILQRFSAENERVRGHERRLRKMLEDRIRETRHIQGAAFRVWNRQLHNIQMRPGQIADELRRGDMPLWQPKRIMDDALGRLAVSYFEKTGEMEKICWSSKIDLSYMTSTSDALNEFQNAIEERMDALKWPEVGS